MMPASPEPITRSGLSIIRMEFCFRDFHRIHPGPPLRFHAASPTCLRLRNYFARTDSNPLPGGINVPAPTANLPNGAFALP